jgi:hypothetical protein
MGQTHRCGRWILHHCGVGASSSVEIAESQQREKKPIGVAFPFAAKCEAQVR